jgi:predicted nucleic acid-binding protein
MKNRRFVTDAWAILAFLQKEEPAASRVKQLLEEAKQKKVEVFLSVINLGEVYYRVGKTKGEKEAEETLEEIHNLPISILSVDEKRVIEAGKFKMRYPISYADAFAAAASYALSATLLTGDPELFLLQHEIDIEKLYRTLK